MRYETILNQPVIATEWFDLRPVRKSDQGLIEHYGSDPRVARMTTSIPHPLPPGAAQIVAQLRLFNHKLNRPLQRRHVAGRYQHACFAMGNCFRSPGDIESDHR